MMQEYDEQMLAAGKIGIAIKRLAGRYPFHAQILERLQVQCRPSIPTMAVTVYGDAVLLLHNPKFVLSIPMDQLVGVLLHEVNHILFGHVVADPAKFPDEWARIVSEELTANEYIVKEPLPRGVIRLNQFPGLPRRESTPERYQRLQSVRRRIKLVMPADGAGTGNTEGKGKRTAAGTMPVPGGRKKGGESGVIFDDHGVWQEALADRQRSAAALRAVIHDAAIEVGAGQIPDYLRKALGAMAPGTLPGDEQEVLEGRGVGQIPWGQELRRYVGQIVEIQPDFRWPPRRFPHLVGVVPGRRRRGSLPKVMGVIDVSGSMTTELLEQVSAELGQPRHRRQDRWERHR